MIGSIKKLSSYNGTPCYEVSENAVTVNGCSGCIGAANTSVDNVPSCVSLRNNDVAQVMQQNSPGAKFDPINWVKENPLYAAGITIAAYFILFKK